MTRVEAYQLALDFFVKKNHSTAGTMIRDFDIEDVLTLAQILLEWAHPTIKTTDGTSVIEKEINLDC